MSQWDLYIYDQAATNLLAQYSNASPGPIVDGFTWRIGPGGDNLQLVFNAVPSQMPWPIDMCVVQLRIDGSPVFFGVINQFWPRDESDEREYVVVGISELYKRRFAISPRFDSVAVENIVNSLVSNYGHPLSSIGTIEATGQVGSLGSAGPVDLYTLLSDLAKQVGFVWGVDSSGAFFFKRPTTEITADYHWQGLAYLPANASEMVTKGVVFGGEHKAGGKVEVWAEYNDGPAWATLMGTWEGPTLSKRLYSTYEAPEHAVYGLEKAAVSPILKTTEYPSRTDPKAPSGQSIIKLLGGASQTFSGPFICSLSGGVEKTIDENSDGTPNLSTGWKAIVGEPAAVYTWLGATWTLNLPDWAVWGYDEFGGVALKVYVESNKDLGADIKITAYVGYEDPDDPGVYRENAFVLDSSTLTSGFWIKFLRLPATAQIRLVFEPVTSVYTPPACSSSSDYIIIKSVMGWGAMIPDAEQAAKSLISIPYQEPTEVQWINQIVDPADLVKLTTGGGTATAEVAEIEYTLTPSETKTVMKLGDRGISDDARVLRIYISDTGARAAILGAGA